MLLPRLLAHGVLGPFDEIIFVSVVVVFLAFMGISWVRSRHIEPEFEEDISADPDLTADVNPDSPIADRFKLD